MSKNAVIAVCIFVAAFAAGAWVVGGTDAMMTVIGGAGTALFGLSIGCSVSNIAKNIASRKNAPPP